MAANEEDSGGSWLKTFFTSLPGVLTGVAALLTAIAALAGVFFTGGGDDGGGTTSAQGPQPQVELLSPGPQEVAWETPVTIRYAHLRKGSEIWLIERTNRYYPQPRCPGRQPQPSVDRAGRENGTWTETYEIGARNARPGDTIELLALLTNKQASELLSEQIRTWCGKAPWQGISKLPEEGAQVKDSVTVSR
jgi:hypothetical protein